MPLVLPGHLTQHQRPPLRWELIAAGRINRSALGQPEHQALGNLQQEQGCALLQFTVKRKTKWRETLKVVDESTHQHLPLPDPL